MGRLAGYVTIDEAMADPLIARYMTALMDRETGPTLPEVPGIDLPRYKATLIERFANPAIKDTVERVNTDAPLNILVDPIRDRLRAGEPVDLLALAWPPGCAGCAARTSRASRSMSAIRSPNSCARRRSRAGRTRVRCWGSPQLFGDDRHRSAPGRAGRALAGIAYMRKAAAGTLAEASAQLGVLIAAATVIVRPR